jgi:hypothetical protein
VPFSFCIRKAECLASSSQASSQFIRPDSNKSLEILRIPVLHLVTQANNLIAFENIYWASFEAMKRKRLNAMPALLKFLAPLGNLSFGKSFKCIRKSQLGSWKSSSGQSFDSITATNERSNE